MGEIISTKATGLGAKRTQVRFQITSALRRHEATWLLVVSSRRAFRRFVVRRSSDIVIDGYFRSANTFSVEAFRSVNPSVAVVEHLHSPFQFIRAARFGVPAILLIRQPEDAVASELVRSPLKLADDAMRDWLFFYETARTVAESIVIAPFEEVTCDFSVAIRVANRMYDRNFALYVNSPVADAATFDAVDHYFRAGKGQQLSEERFEKVVGRPHSARGGDLGAARSAVSREALDQNLGRARDLYAEFLEIARRQRAAL